jgi:beta-glucosidase
MFNLGLFENAYTDPQYAKTFVGTTELQETAQREGHIAAAVMLKNKGNVLPQRTSETHKPTVYIPLDEKNAAVVNLNTAQRYYNVPAEIITAVAENRQLTAAEKTSAISKSDFALIKLNSPRPPNNGAPPQNLMYSPYTAQWQRQISLGYDWVHADGSMVMFGAGETPDILAGDYMNNRSIRNGLTHDGIPAALNMINETVAAMGNKPVVFALSMTNPMVVSDFEPYVDAIIVGGGISDVAILELISGNYEPNGLLSVNFPLNMETVELANEDSGHDMVPYLDEMGNRYIFGFGLNWKGRISDARTAKYVQERHYPLSEKRGLENYIERAKKLDAADYQKVAAALTTGEAVYANTNATQKEVNIAAEALRNIFNTLPDIKIAVLTTKSSESSSDIEVVATAVTFTPKNTIVLTLKDKDNNVIDVAAVDQNGKAILQTKGTNYNGYTIIAKSGEFTGNVVIRQ